MDTRTGAHGKRMNEKNISNKEQKKVSVEKFKYVLPKVPEAEPADSTELEKDMSRTSMNAMWEELKNDIW